MADTITPTLTDEDVEKYVAEIAAKKYEELQKASGVTPQTVPQELVLNVAGQEFKFKDAAEASARLTSLYDQAKTAPVGQSTGRTVTDDKGTDPNNPSWTPEDQQAYVDLLVKNPMKAAEYVDTKRFGMANPTEFMRQNLQTTANLAISHTVDAFVASHPDYPVSPENAQVMNNLLSELGGGRPVYTPTALEAAFAIADKRGLIKRPQENNNQPQRQQTTNPYLVTPPVAGRSAGALSPNFEREAESMTADQIEQMMFKLQG